MKNCTLLWRETRFEVKMHKTPCSEHFRKLRYEKNVARSTYIFKSKWAKHTVLGASMEAEMMKQLHAVLVRSTFGSQKCEKLTVSDHFWRRLATSEQNVGVL